MPPVGLEPATSTYAARTVTQLTKWAEGAEMKLRIRTFALKSTRVVESVKCASMCVALSFWTGSAQGVPEKMKK